MSDSELSLEPPEDVERKLSDAGWWLIKAERLMRADPSFADTLPKRIRKLAERADMDAEVVRNRNEGQARRLDDIASALYMGAEWLENAAATEEPADDPT